MLSVADALNGFASAVSALETTRAGQGLATTVNAGTAAVSGQRQADILQYLQGVNRNAQLSDFEKAQTVYTRAQIEGVTESEIAKAWGASADETRRWFANAGVPQFAGGGDHAGGLRIVGERGIELEATGPSRIWSADQTRSMLGGNTARLEALVEALSAQVQALQAAQERGNAHAARAANALDGQNGPLRVEVET